LIPYGVAIDAPFVFRYAEDLRAMRHAHERFLSSGLVNGVRDLVAASWRRSADAGVPVDAPAAPVAVPADELVEYRDAHPLARVFPLLYDVLGRAAEECDSVLAVGDARGRLLWVCGRPGVLRRAERIHFTEGAAWDEASAGTNAPGTALRLDAPVQILAAEHFARPVQQWTCAAAPIHDPVTQAVLGVVDVTGGDDIATPQALAMVRAAARMAEAELGRLIAVRAVPPPTVDQPSFAALGRPDCLVEVGGRSLRLSPRHSEIAVLLVDHANGLSGGQLAVELYRDDVRASTMRAELTRLRALLGPDLLDSRPYRLRETPRCDWVDVERAVAAGRVADALSAYGGPLLPQSDAPGVVARRDRLELRLRAAVLTSDDADLMGAWTRTRWGADDLEMWQRQRQLAAPGSPLRAVAEAETTRLDRELGA